MQSDARNESSNIAIEIAAQSETSENVSSAVTAMTAYIERAGVRGDSFNDDEFD